GGIIEIYEKFVGEDPRKVPMKIFPAVHYSMGGLWVDFDQMTNIPGIFAAVECDYSQHGGNRLGANSRLSAIYGGMVAGPNAIKYIDQLETHVTDMSSELFDRRQQAEQEKFDEPLKMDGAENAYQLHQELGERMTDNVAVVRDNRRVVATDTKLVELLARWTNIRITDRST